MGDKLAKAGCLPQNMSRGRSSCGRRQNGGDVLTIYLCGPIMDEHGGKARAWRETARRELGRDFALLDPMRRNFKDREVDSANEIVEFDLQDVREADLLLVNYSKPSIGTAMEVFYASHDLGKFVIAFSPFPFEACSPWMVKFTTKILPSLEAAIDYVTTHFAADSRRLTTHEEA